MLSKIGSITNHNKNKQQVVSIYPSGNVLLTTTRSALRNMSMWYMQVSANRNYICTVIPTGGSTPRICTSSNGGQSYSITSNVSDNFTYIAMSNDAQYMYIIAKTKVYYSNLNGASWVPIIVTGAINLYAITCNSTGQYVYTIDNSTGYIYRSTDYGLSYSLFKQIGSAGTINLIYCESINCLFTNTTANSTSHIYKYDINSNTITTWKPNLSSNYVNWIDVSSNGQYIYAMYQNQSSNQMYKSSDFGSSWVGVSIVSGANGLGDVYCSPNGKYVYVKNGGTSFYYSSDYGSTFTNNTTIFPSGYGMNQNQYKNTLFGINGAGFYLSY